MAKKIKTAVDAALWEANVSRVAQSPTLQREVLRKGYFIDSEAIHAKRIKDGQTVGEHWLKGKNKETLIKDHGLTEKDFEKYT